MTRALALALLCLAVVSPSAQASVITLDDDFNVVSTEEDLADRQQTEPTIEEIDPDGPADGKAGMAKVRKRHCQTNRDYAAFHLKNHKRIAAMELHVRWCYGHWKISNVKPWSVHIEDEWGPALHALFVGEDKWETYHFKYKNHPLGGYRVRRRTHFKFCMGPWDKVCPWKRDIDMAINLHADGTLYYHRYE